ncbi:Cd2+/Zn2+-exporting ATPase [Erysipelotrichaceae bacterium]|nr:Cd2+/Zn2+-exporting ATPase [Erysipelotrichaceae bacterium]
MNRIIKNIELIATILSGFLIFLGLFLQTTTNFSAVSPYIFVSSFIIGGYSQAVDGIKSTIKEHKLNVELLMVLAAIGASIIGFWLEGAILIFIFSLSGALENYTSNKSKQEIYKLMELQPTSAKRLNADGSFEYIDPNLLQIGDVIIAPSGQAISTDGIVIAGASNVNEAAITGEPLPVNKAIGDEVYGGTLNMHHPLSIKVTKNIEDTLVREIIRMVEQAQQAPSKTAQFIERIETKYVTIVLMSCILLLILPPFLLQWSWQNTFYRAMVFLVVASPCALIASVTPATLAAISRGARMGILVKGGIHLENLSAIKAVAFDKTGTLTQGKPVITDYFLIGNIEKEDITPAIIALEHLSNHPLAMAITSNLFLDTNLILPEITDAADIPGFGISGVIDNHLWKIGKYDFMDTDAEAVLQQKATDSQKEGCTLVYIQKDATIIGYLALKDTVRPEAAQLIATLNHRNIETIMLTGDNMQTATNIATQLGIKTVIANCLPSEKVAAIEQLMEQHHSVAMVGDGINDAPALAVATVGIAMGKGSDIALEAADIVLMHSDISKLAYAHALSVKLHHIITINICFSLAVIFLLLCSNFFQIINLPLGVIGHEGSTILVILNGLTLLTFRQKEKTRKHVSIKYLHPNLS